MSEIKDSVCSAFQDASKRGILADETLRGARFNLVDGKLHQDSVHRNGAQIVPCSRKLFQALELASMPTLLEPIFVCEISAPFAVLGGVYNTLSQRRASILE